MAETNGSRTLFVAATRQNEGKTTVSLGLLSAFHDICPPVGFMKPVGQRYVEVDDVRVHSFTSRRRKNSTFPIKLICIRVFIEYFRLSFQIVNDCFMSYASA